MQVCQRMLKYNMPNNTNVFSGLTLLKENNINATDRNNNKRIVQEWIRFHHILQQAGYKSENAICISG